MRTREEMTHVADGLYLSGLGWADFTACGGGTCQYDSGTYYPCILHHREMNEKSNLSPEVASARTS
jgi:hypothetical protein